MLTSTIPCQVQAGTFCCQNMLLSKFLAISWHFLRSQQPDRCKHTSRFAGHDQQSPGGDET